MRYAKPSVVTAEKAILAIQQVNQAGSMGKTCTQFFDRDLFCCSAGAYEADE